MDLLSYCGECRTQWAGTGIIGGKLECPRCGAIWEPATGKVTPGTKTRPFGGNDNRRAERYLMPADIAADLGIMPKTGEST